MRDEFERKVGSLKAKLSQRASKDPSFWVFNQMASADMSFQKENQFEFYLKSAQKAIDIMRSQQRRDLTSVKLHREARQISKDRSLSQERLYSRVSNKLEKIEEKVGQRRQEESRRVQSAAHSKTNSLNKKPAEAPPSESKGVVANLLEAKPKAFKPLRAQGKLMFAGPPDSGYGSVMVKRPGSIETRKVQTAEVKRRGE